MVYHKDLDKQDLHYNMLCESVSIDILYCYIICCPVVLAMASAYGFTVLPHQTNVLDGIKIIHWNYSVSEYNKRNSVC